jgi:autotransporter-associated beta strand protein
MVSPAGATSDSWKTNASGNWNDVASWTAGNIPGSTATLNNTDVATFGFTLATSGKTVTVDANRNIGGITFSNTSAFGYTLSGGSLKLSSGGVIQSTSGNGAHTDTISSAIEIQGDGGAATFTNNATSASSLMNIGAVTGVSTGSNVTTLTLNGTQNPSGVLETVVSGVIGNGSGGGKLAILKDGTGTWTLGNTNNIYSGGTEAKAGTLRVTSAGALGTGDLTLSGGTVHLINNANTTFGNNVKVTASSGIAATRVSGNAGAVTQTLGSLEIGANTLTVTKFSATTLGTLVFGNTTLTGNAEFAPAASTVVQLGAVSGGAFSLTQNGAGTTILSATNTLAAATVTTGVLQVGVGGTTGDLGSASVSIASVGALSFARSNAATFTNSITGAGVVRSTGANSVITLTNDSHTGSTQIQNGVLQTNNTATTNIVLGTSGSTFNYGTLGLTSNFTGALGTAPGSISWATGINTSGGFAVMDAATRSVNIGGNAVPDTLTLNTGGFVGGTLGSSNSRIKFGDINGLALGTVDFKNSINLGSGDRSLVFIVDGAAQYTGNVSGNIIGSGLASGTGDAIVKFGNANLLLSGTNTYTGRTVVGGQGSIILNSASAFSANTWMHLDGGAAGTLGGILGLGYDLNADLGVTGGKVNFATSGGFAAFGADHSVTLNSGGDLSWASTTSFVANAQNLILGQAKADGKITLTNNINLNAAVRTVQVNDGTSAIDGELSGNLTGAAGGLNKAGTGTLVLSGTSTYTGTTTVSAGRLLVDGALGNTAVTVATTATIGGSGAIGGSLTINGTLAPGNSIESLGSGNLSLANTSTYAYELNSSTLNGDLTYSTGTLDIASGATLTLTELASGALAAGSKLTLISYNGIWNGGLFTYLGGTLADDSSITLGANQWQFNYNDTTGGSNFTGDQGAGVGFVTLTVIPEPASCLLGILSGAALLRRRRHQSGVCI